jgi:beta-lactamase regulating signal transducer with metallopeptidase domain
MATFIRCYPGDRVLDFLLVVGVCVTLVSSVAWIISRRLAGKAALRHLVLLAALGCCLASPILVWFSKAAGIRLVSFSVLCEQSTTKGGGASDEKQYLCEPSHTTVESPQVATPPFSHVVGQNDGTRFSVAPGPTTEPNSAKQTVSAPAVVPIASAAKTISSFRGIATTAIFIWAVGVCLMLARLMRNCLRVVWLRRRASPVADDRIQVLLNIVVSQLGIRQNPLLLISNRTIIPLAIGFGRPAVILPQRLLSVASENELRDILLHEIAHLKRGDQRIVLLQEIAAALYWPIVPIHALNRELQRAREEICDNVVLANRDPIDYGKTLLHIAELLMQARPMRAAVGIIGGRGELERRIAGLIDPRRNLMTKAARKTACVVMFMFIAVSAIVSATRFAATAATTGTTEPAEAAAPEESQREPDSNRTIVLHGKVLGPDNRSVAGAQIYLSLDEWTDPVELGTSDANGSYRFNVPESKLRRTVSGSWIDKSVAALAVTAAGLGPGWEELPDAAGGRYGTFKPEYTHDFHLPNDFPIVGRVVDVNGKPVAGVNVAVEGLIEISDPHWWKLPQAIKAVDLNLMTREETDTNNWFTPLYRTAWKVIAAATTDADGRFRLDGVGGDRVVRLELTGPGIRSATVSSLTRDDVNGFTQAVRDKWTRARRPDGYFWPENTRKGAPEGDQGVLLFGPAPTIEVDPARTISGVVRDATTGEPIAGMQMKTADRLGGGSATTDRHGRYRILRVEDEPSIMIYSDAYHSDRYLTVERTLTDAQGLGEIVADFNIPRGINITGRVLETGTNRPIVAAARQDCHDVGLGPMVAGYVRYYPLATNATLRGAPTGLIFEGIPRGSQNYYLSAMIDGDGKFQLAVPPGPGVLLVQAAPGMPMLAEFVTHKESDGFHRLLPYVPLKARGADDGAPAGDAHSFPGFTRPIPLENCDAYKVINPAAEAKSLELTFNIPRGPTRNIRFGDPNGNVVAGVTVRGLVTSPMSVILEGSEAEVLALEPDKPRDIVAISNDGKYVARTSISATDPPTKTIPMEPAASIVGRIVDRAGNPFKAILSPKQQPLRFDAAGNIEEQPTIGTIPSGIADADGRFKLSPLFPGQHYSAEIRGGVWNNELLGKAFDDVVLNAGEVRDLGDIQIERRPNETSATVPGN